MWNVQAGQGRGCTGTTTDETGDEKISDYRSANQNTEYHKKTVLIGCHKSTLKVHLVQFMAAKAVAAGSETRVRQITVGYSHSLLTTVLVLLPHAAYKFYRRHDRFCIPSQHEGEQSSS